MTHLPQAPAASLAETHFEIPPCGGPGSGAGLSCFSGAISPRVSGPVTCPDTLPRVTPTLDQIDITDPDLYASGGQLEVFRWLREHAPVFFQRQRSGPGFWAITRYDDVRKVSRDPATFISSGGTSTMDLERPESASLDYEMMQGTLVITDPPRHTKLRALVNKAFTPQAVARLEPFVRDVVDQVLDDAAAAGMGDFVTDVAARLPYVVICEMLGIPREDRPELFAAIRPMMMTDLTQSAGTMLDPMKAATTLIDYLKELIEKRAATAREDLVSDLVLAEVDGEQLSRADMLALCILLFIAGTETTMNATAGGMLAFFEHPVEQRRLMDDRSLMPTAVEEILRYCSPTLVSMVRTATRDVELRGERILAGQKVTLWYGSANRDEETFAEADRFDVSRTPNDHVTFGYGAHFCLGAQLARLELRVVFGELFDRLPGVALDGEPKRLRSNIFNGLERLPVRFR
jgi:cholest-4-en-3-one 26-monooxygenase